MTYAEKLRSPYWQRKRLEIYERDEFKCRACNDAEKTLNVHHLVYEYGKDPWEYSNDKLITLCEDCHFCVTDAKKNIRNMIDMLYISPSQLELLEQIVWSLSGLDDRSVGRVKSMIRDLNSDPSRHRQPILL